MKEKSIVNQIQRNSVALISLFIAVSSLSYNTWRNERTEENRNQRHAAFEILVKLNELQQLIFHHHYDSDTENKGNLRTGWALVLTIQDFSKVSDDKLQQSSNQLYEVWDNDSENISSDEGSVILILEAVEKVRTSALVLLKSLD